MSENKNIDTYPLLLPNFFVHYDSCYCRRRAKANGSPTKAPGLPVLET
jgi:hypothetical protein